MLLTVEEFCRRTTGDMPSLVHDLQEQTGRFGEAEKEAWGRSLVRVASVLERSDLSRFHIHLGQSGSLSLEYRLPASSSWCDVVLLGRSQQNPLALIMELKDWTSNGDQPGPREGLIRHRGELTLHPSEQVRGYVEYCRRFHSGVQASGACVEGCVFMTHGPMPAAFARPPHDRLVAEFPVFGASKPDLENRLPAYLRAQLSTPDPEFAQAFESGGYRQDRNFVRQVARSILHPEGQEFVLLDHQRLGFERCMETIGRILSRANDKAVVIIEGPPGSGKSVIAAKLWAAVARDERIRSSVVLATTSASQKANWKSIFARVAGNLAGRGLVVPANQFNPGLSPRWVTQQREQGHALRPSDWRDNVELFLKAGHRNRMPDDSLAVTIVDEAHALIDPTAPGAEGAPPSGWSVHAGPQGWHVIRASRVSVFLMDSEQSYRDNETTRRESIERWARELGVTDVASVSLEDAQFRCAGSKDYLDWLDSVLGIRSPASVRIQWRRREGKGDFTFDVVDDPAALDERLRARSKGGHSVRLVASYGRPWKTKKYPSPHTVSPAEMDFSIPYRREGRPQVWSRVWNHAPDQDYTLFIQAPTESAVHENPLAEVGCPYVVRGFDFDYLGVLWLKDLVWRGEWVADLEHVHESAWPKTKAAARRNRRDPAAQRELVRRLQRGYRILLSRAIRGVHVWFEDEETRAHVEQRLDTQGITQGTTPPPRPL